MTATAVVSTCYAACGTAWTECYIAAGLVAGTVVASPFAPAAAMVCNAAEGACMVACTSAAAIFVQVLSRGVVAEVRAIRLSRHALVEVVAPA